MKYLRHDNSVSNYYKTHIPSITPINHFQLILKVSRDFFKSRQPTKMTSSGFKAIKNTSRTTPWTNMCNFVLVTAHADGLVPLRTRPSAGAMKSECGPRVYTGRAVKVVNTIQNTGMEMGWINLQYCAKSRLWPPLIMSWVFSTVSA